MRGNFRFYGNNVVYDHVFDNKPPGVVINGDLELLMRLNGIEDLVLEPEEVPLGAPGVEARGSLADLLEEYGGSFGIKTDGSKRDIIYLCILRTSDKNKLLHYEFVAAESWGGGNFYIMEGGERKNVKQLKEAGLNPVICERTEGGWVVFKWKYDYTVRVDRFKALQNNNDSRRVLDWFRAENNCMYP